MSLSSRCRTCGSCSRYRHRPTMPASQSPPAPAGRASCRWLLVRLAVEERPRDLVECKPVALADDFKLAMLDMPLEGPFEPARRDLNDPLDLWLCPRRAAEIPRHFPFIE